MRKLLIISLLLLAAGAVLGQGMTTGTLEVLVMDEGGRALSGAVVTAVGPQGAQTLVSNDRGQAVFRGLTPGPYQVKAEADGHATVVQSEVEIFINRRTQLPFRLPKGLSEEVTVRSEAPVVDMKTTSTGAAIKVDTFAPYVPLGRNLVSTFSIAPGVSDGGDVGSSNQSISGSSGLENAYFVDGVNITNSGYGALGAYSIVYGSLGTGVTYDFLEEVQVKTGGFEAEFGQAGGGVVNSVVKSGTNDFDVDVSWYETVGSLEGGRGMLELSPNRANRLEANRTDISFSVGGPLIKDKLFYFLAYNPISIESDFGLTSGDGTTAYDLNGDGTASDFFGVGEIISGGRLPSSVTRKRSIDNYAGKFAYFITPNHRVEATFFGDPSDGDVGPQAPTAYMRVLSDPILNPDPNSSATGLDWGGDQYTFKYHGVWSPNFFTEVQWSHKENTFEEIGPGVTFRSVYDANLDSTFGGAGFFENLADETDQYSIKFTNVIGPVELKYGVQIDELDWRQPRQYSGPTYNAYIPRLVEGVSIDSDGDGTADTTGVGLQGDGSFGSSYMTLESGTGASIDLDDGVYNVTRTGFGPLGEFTTAEETNYFAQISWDVTSTVNINAGLRWTEQDLAGAGTFTLPITEIGGSLAVGETVYRPKEYTFDSELAPRFGISWDVMGDGKQKLYANYGEYYQRVPSDLAVRQFSNEVGVEGEIFNDAGLTSPANDSLCWVDTNSDGVYDSQVGCHLVHGTGAHPGVILDGSAAAQGFIEDLGLTFSDVSNGEATKLPYVEEWLVGWAWELNDYTGIEIRYINREIGRTIEDVQFASNEQIWNQFWGDALADGEVFDGHGFSSFGAYVLSNPGENVNATLFPPPTRDYEALEFILNRRFHNGWMAYINYRFGRLRGNFEGSFRNDNGQSDPFITSLYDLPAASILADGTAIPSMTLAGQYTVGPLNTDRRHILNAFVSRQFEFGLNVGMRATVRSGQPRFPLFAHPTYRNAGEIPGANPVYWWIVETADFGNQLYTNSDATTNPENDGSFDFDGDGDGDEILDTLTGPRLYSYDVVKRDHFGRNPWTFTVDLHASYDFEVGKGKLTAMMDIFNLFGDNSATAFDNDVENRPGTPNINYLRADTYQAPRTVRLGVKYHW